MATLELVRLDGRLAHGTVCSTWVQRLGIDHIIIIHDLYCKDEFYIKLNQQVAPRGVKTDTISSDDAARMWKENQFGSGHVLVLFGEVETAHLAWEKGFDYSELQVGTVSNVPGKQKKTVAPQVNINEQEADLLKDLGEKGVRVYLQVFPQDNQQPLADVLSGVNFGAKKSGSLFGNIFGKGERK